MNPLSRTTSLVFFPVLLSVVASAHEFDELSTSEILALLEGPSKQEHLSNLKSALQEDTEGSLARRFLEDAELKPIAYKFSWRLEGQWSDLILAYQVEDSNIWETEGGFSRSPDAGFAARISDRFSIKDASWKHQLMLVLNSKPGRASLGDLLRRLAEIPIEDRADDSSAFRNLKDELFIETKRYENAAQTERERAVRHAQRGSNLTRPRSNAGPNKRAEGTVAADKRAEGAVAETGSNPENRRPSFKSWVVGVSVVLLFSCVLIYLYSKKRRQV